MKIKNTLGTRVTVGVRVGSIKIYAEVDDKESSLWKVIKIIKYIDVRSKV